MTYKEFILQFVEDDTAYGDIARDIAQDDAFPNTNDYEEMDYYLTLTGASDSFLRVLEETYEEYKKRYIDQM